MNSTIIDIVVFSLKKEKEIYTLISPYLTNNTVDSAAIANPSPISPNFS
jgi:hypothetical protein